LSRLQATVALKHLVLGHDAHIGHERQGNRLLVENFAAGHGFSVEYLPPLEVAGAPVSSSRIRQALHAGNLALAAKLLGRPYALKLPIQKGQGIGKKMGVSTANLPVDRLALP